MSSPKNTILEIENLSIRKKQAFAAFCMARFASSLGIVDQLVEDFVIHLVSILKSKDLNEWMFEKSKILLAAEGEPLPHVLEQRLTSAQKRSLEELRDVAVEVGISDIYARPSDIPLKMLTRCIEILNENDVELPQLTQTKLLEVGEDSSAWGQPVSESEYQKVLLAVRVFLEQSP